MGLHHLNRKHSFSPTNPGSNPIIPKKISEEKLLMLLRFINSTGKRKLDSDLKMLIELI